ncbi:thrombospondin type 3 repeat-containing protein, partial [Patescibacteria group bacterium]|nr:thrombospondin type 3 repeat-containing protein [Patescibacteria group bacterium]
INSNSKKPLSQKTIVFILAVIQAVVVGSVYFTFLSKEDNNNNNNNNLLSSEVVDIEVVKDKEATEFEINKTIDSDQDGLSDYLEKILGTDENNPDTDGDSYDDYNEIKNGYNPLTDEKYTEEEWEMVKEKIRKEDEGLFGEMFGGC